MKAFGIILLALGFFALTYTGLRFASIEELNNLEIIISQGDSFIWMAAIIGIIDLMIGFSLLFTAKSWI